LSKTIKEDGRGMQKAEDFLELALHFESEAAKAQDKFLRNQLLSFAETYRVLAEKHGGIGSFSKGP
jgi:hypothetical protein